MSPLHQLDPIDFQFLCQMLARRSFEKALEHQDHNRARPADPFEHGVGKHIIDRSTDRAARVHHRSAMSVMGLLPFWQGMSMRTVQSVWMQGFDQPVIARLFIQQGLERKDQHGSLPENAAFSDSTGKRQS
jgi:hypothetical protein